MVSFSVVIITHGREELLLKCLDSLRPLGATWQLILVANGKELSATVLDQAHALTTEVDILNLPQVERPGVARNLGVKLVRHEWVYFIDDDAYVYPRYFEKVLPLLHQERVDVLGGPDAPAKGMGAFSQALAMALSSPFCTGKTFARHKSKGRELIPANEDLLTSCNLWVRSRFFHDVHFPEHYLRTEETALLIDLQRQGAHLFYHPDLIVGHQRRKKLAELWEPTYFAGYYRSKVIKDKSLKGGGVFWLPSVFVLLHLMVFVDPEIFIAMARLYLGIILMMSLNLAARRRRIGLFGYIAFFHYFIVFVYGIGFLSQRLGFRGNN